MWEYTPHNGNVTCNRLGASYK